ncbi:MAG: DUF4129 domain-containing protein [Limnochordia bacterium]|jgi:hypothetical protein
MGVGVTRLRRMTPLVEGFFLPITGALASAGVAAVALRLMALATGLETGWLAYVALFVAGAIGAGAGALRDLLELPRTLRLLDLLMAVLVGAVLLYLGPRTSGTLHIGGGSQSVSLIGAGLIGVVLAWSFGSSLAWVVARVYPYHLAQPHSEVLAERLLEQAKLQEAYVFRRSMSANIEAWRSAVQVTLTLILLYLVMTLLWTPLQQERGDILLAVWTSVAFGGVLAFLGLVHLAGNRRLEERSGNVVVLPGYSRAWAGAVYVPLLVIAVLGIALPSDISPLAHVDWNAVMTSFTQWLVGWAFTGPAKKAMYQGVSAGHQAGELTHHAPAVYGGTGGSGPFGVLVVIGIPLALYIIWYGIRRLVRMRDYSVEQERERGRGLLAILWAIITWPWQALVRWWRSARPSQGAVRVQKDRSDSPRARRQRRRGARVHPEDPALFVRYIYGRALLSAARAGFQRPKHQTALEYARSLAERVPDTAEPMQELTQSYCHVRYTDQEPEKGIGARSVRLLRAATRGLRSARRARVED